MQPDTVDNWTRDHWEELSSNPDIGDDLGYQLSNWERFETLDGTDQTIFLPNDESELKDAAFVVADDEIIKDLENHC